MGVTMGGQGKLHRLTALRVARLRKPGLYNDGGGLNLQITERGAKSWIFRYRLGDRRRDMGLGPVSDVSLADARAQAARCRRQRERGEDPIEVREAARAKAALDAARAMTFDQCAAAFITAHEAAWKNRKHAAQWRNTLSVYASPVFGMVSVQDVDIGLVMKAVEPLWTTKTETAKRVRGRIEAILDWAKVRGYRSGENPARWRGHLDHLLPKPSNVHKTVHHCALPFDQMPAFMGELRQQEGKAARALELALTGTRTSEVLLSRWQEFDLDAKVWTIPDHRMKAKREHRVPLSSAARNHQRHDGDGGWRSRISRCAARSPDVEHGDALGPRPHGAPGRNHSAWLSQQLSNLGCGNHQFSARGLRACPRPFVAEPGRGRLPARRPVREAAAPHDGLGGVLFQVSRGKRCTACGSAVRQLALAWHGVGRGEVYRPPDSHHRTGMAVRADRGWGGQ
jgi:integrase